MLVERRCSSGAQNPPLETDRWKLGAGRLSGQNGYDYIAEGRGEMEGLTVLWGRSDTAPDHGTARRFKVFIRSERLWRSYAAGLAAYDCAASALHDIGRDLWTSPPSPERVRVRRIDVCVDHWGYRWTLDDTKKFACRQRSRGIDERGEKMITDLRTVTGPLSSTYYIGKRGGATRYLRVYDKVAEAASSGKLPWMQPAWLAHGWDGETTVWRAEVEFGGEWLKGHGFSDMTKLVGCEHALWLNYVGDVRHTTGTASRVKRAPTSRVWRCLRGAVQRAKRCGMPATWTWCPRPPSAGADMRTLSAMAAGCIRKLEAAMFGDGSGDAKDRLWSFMQDALAQSKERADARAANLAALGSRRSRPPPKPPPIGN